MNFQFRWFTNDTKVNRNWCRQRGSLCFRLSNYIDGLCACELQMFSIGTVWTNANQHCRVIQHRVDTRVRRAMIKYFHRQILYRRLPMCYVIAWRRRPGAVMNLVRFWYVNCSVRTASDWLISILTLTLNSLLGDWVWWSSGTQKPNAAFSDTTKPNQFQSSNNNSSNTDDNMPQKNNNMSSLSSTSANKSTMNHESPKDHSINIENAAPYYQGKCS